MFFKCLQCEAPSYTEENVLIIRGKELGSGSYSSYILQYLNYRCEMNLVSPSNASIKRFLKKILK